MMTSDVTYNDHSISSMGEFSIGGVSRDTIEDTAFEDRVKKYIFGIGSGGDFSFSGYYDPDDSNGQDLIDIARFRGTLIGKELRFHVDEDHHFQISTPGKLLITKSKSIVFDKNNLGKIAFSGTVSGGVFDLVKKTKLFDSAENVLFSSDGYELFCYQS